ncbi:P-loop containing nucleoside triphosphate hydrolase protein, partial [Pilobolus umbonatus]
RHAYRKLGIRPSKGILLYGPPGTGKTMLAKAVATESAANFLAIRIPDLIKGEVGESEKAVSKIFQTAIRCSPCVIFLDELEAIFASRESSGDVGRKVLISQFLIEIDHLDKLDQSVILLGATNHPESIDDSILRPGRLDKLVYVGAPNPSERVQILQVLKQKTKLEDQVDLNKIAAITQGYTGADLKAVMRKAGLIALKKNVSVISQEHIELAVKSVQPSLKESLSDGTSEDSEEWEDE